MILIVETWPRPIHCTVLEHVGLSRAVGVGLAQCMGVDSGHVAFGIDDCGRASPGIGSKSRHGIFFFPGTPDHVRLHRLQIRAIIPSLQPPGSPGPAHRPGGFLSSGLGRDCGVHRLRQTTHAESVRLLPPHPRNNHALRDVVAGHTCPANGMHCQEDESGNDVANLAGLSVSLVG